MPVKIPYPYFELRFNADGSAADAKQLPALIAGLRDAGATDVFLASHGWNNDQKEAHALYGELFTNVKAQEKNVPVGGRVFAVAGVIWPSKRFDVAEDSPNAASLGTGTARIGKQVDALLALLKDGPNAAKHAVDLKRAKEIGRAHV